MSRWKLSYIIHAAIWIVLCVLALFYQSIAHLPIVLIIVFVILSTKILGFLTGATDPLALHSANNLIPEDAWTVYGLFWLAFLNIWIIVGLWRWGQGSRGLILLSVHFVLFLIGLISLGLLGSINFEFST